MTSKSDRINMLEELIVYAGKGKNISLHAKPVREAVLLEREGREIKTVILSMEYSGFADDKPFRFKKNYSFVDDLPQYSLDCLMVANNRLQMDVERLKDVGITADFEFFNFKNCMLGIPEDISAKSPVLRLQDFVQLSRAGVGVSVDLSLSRPSIELEQEGAKKKGFGCIGTFTFTTGKEKTTIEKLYGIGGYDDAKADDESVVDVANRRLERDCQRLRSAGITVERPLFLPIWERVFDK
ncbi:hypothetical protein PITCH_A50057 [uncultured Desulfobacterium sp.]|uniref:Uncharacterized protein n=1 Tax=uncultured Desulfobacterium sp. TaxID=201089 RepID=A0A445N0J6_9BACT|nr:hypothetical protein PITCH_A50057 [uncultured Desulfobacterium sp.]